MIAFELIHLDVVSSWFLYSSEDKKNITYKLLPKKPTKVLQDTLHSLYHQLMKELPRHGHDDVQLDMTGAEQDFKRKHKEVGVNRVCDFEEILVE